MNAALQKFSETTMFPPGPFAWEVRHTAEGKKVAELLVTRAPMPFNDPVIFALREDWMGRQSPEREAVKQAIVALPILIEALVELTPYLEKISQPGDRWPALCARQALQAAGILPPEESEAPAAPSSSTAPADKLYAALALTLQTAARIEAEGDWSEAVLQPEVNLLSEIFEHAFTAAESRRGFTSSAASSLNAAVALDASTTIYTQLAGFAPEGADFGTPRARLEKAFSIAQIAANRIAPQEPTPAEPTFRELYAFKNA